MRIKVFEWDEQNIDHIARHGVNPEEVEEACYNALLILRKGGLYLIYGQTYDGRYLLAVCRYRGRGIIRTVTARDMTDNEKKLSQKRR